MKQQQAIAILEALLRTDDRDNPDITDAAIVLMSDVGLAVYDVPLTVAAWIGCGQVKRRVPRGTGVSVFFHKARGRWCANFLLSNGKYKRFYAPSRERVEERMQLFRKLYESKPKARVPRPAVFSDLPICPHSISGQMPNVAPPEMRNGKPVWSDDHLKLLGVYHDSVIAEIMRLPIRCVNVKRRTLGKASPRLMVKCSHSECGRLVPVFKKRVRQDWIAYCSSKCQAKDFAKRVKRLAAIGRLSEDQNSISGGIRSAN